MGGGGHLTLYSAEVNSAWGYTFSHPYAFTVCTGIILPLPDFHIYLYT